MKQFLSILAALFAASAIAAEPKPYLTIDASGQAVVKSGLPAGTKVNYQIIRPGTQDALLCIYWPEGDRARLAIFNYAFVPYGEPEPQPIPDPPPVPPDPIPPPPAVKIWGLVIVHETKKTTPEQSKVISSKAIDDYTRAKGWHKTKVYDQDVVNENNAEIAVVKAYAARAKSLPSYFLVSEPDATGKADVLSEGSLPSESNLLGILEKIGGKK